MYSQAKRLEGAIKEKGLDLEPLLYYIESFRHGVKPHAGAGIGLVHMKNMPVCLYTNMFIYLTVFESTIRYNAISYPSFVVSY